MSDGHSYHYSPDEPASEPGGWVNSWAEETMQIINKLTPDIKGKAFDPDWFMLRRWLEEMENRALAAARPASEPEKRIIKLMGRLDNDQFMQVNIGLLRKLLQSARPCRSEDDLLRKALLEFGKHAHGCSKRAWECSQPDCAETHSRPCDCGLEAALASATAQEESRS